MKPNHRFSIPVMGGHDVNDLFQIQIRTGYGFGAGAFPGQHRYRDQRSGVDDDIGPVEGFHGFDRIQIRITRTGTGKDDRIMCLGHIEVSLSLGLVPEMIHTEFSDSIRVP